MQYDAPCGQKLEFLNYYIDGIASSNLIFFPDISDYQNQTIQVDFSQTDF